MGKEILVTVNPVEGYALKVGSLTATYKFLYKETAGAFDSAKKYFLKEEDGSFTECKNLTAFETGKTYYENLSSGQAVTIKDQINKNDLGEYVLNVPYGVYGAITLNAAFAPVTKNGVANSEADPETPAANNASSSQAAGALTMKLI